MGTAAEHVAPAHQPEPTLDHVEATIDFFIFQLNDPIVLAITGGWGEGKTYFWKRRILPKYESNSAGYVSVFGAYSLNAIRERVLVSAGEALDLRNQSVSDMTVRRNRWLETVGSALSGMARRWSKSIGIPESVVDQVLEKTLLRKGWILCIDDVERLSPEISTDTFLGYVDQLREEHGLKVILIFNDDWFKNQANKAFATYREKVIDREVPFVPRLEDIIQLVASEEVKADPDLRDVLAHRCTVLRLRNIRVLAKAMRFFREVKSALPDSADKSFCDAALYSLVLFSWIKFVPDRPVQFSDLEGYSGLGRAMTRHAKASKGEGSEDEDELETLLNAYGYQLTDDLDLILMQFVQSGVLNRQALLEEYGKYTDRTSRGLLEREFRETWKKYFHSTLHDNSTAFCQKVAEATKGYIPYISVEQMDSVLFMLSELGDTSVADALFQQFMKSRPNYYSEYTEAAARFEPLRFPPMIDAIKVASERESREHRSLAEVLRDAWDNEFLTDQDRRRLLEFSGKEIAEFLLSLDEEAVTSKIRKLAQMTRRDTDAESRQVAASVVEAVTIIASKSKINWLRMKAMGLVQG